MKSAAARGRSKKESAITLSSLEPGGSSETWLYKQKVETWADDIMLLVFFFFKHLKIVFAAFCQKKHVFFWWLRPVEPPNAPKRDLWFSNYAGVT